MKTKLTLFFTWDVSLKLWQERGLLEREIRFYEELAKQGVEITFLSWGEEEDIEVARTLKNIRTIPLYTKLPRPKNKILRALTSFLIPFAMWKELRHADLLKTNQMWGAWYAVLCSVLTRKPLIVRTGYELYHFTRQQNHGWWRCTFIWLMSFLSYKTATQIYVATTEDHDFIIQNFKIKSEKIDIRPNWIDADLFAPQKQPEKGNHILFVGRLNAQKNLTTLIDAVAGTEFTLDIVGDGELKEELEARAQKRSAKVNFLGNIPNNELPKIYNQYPVFALPSHYEGNPKTLLEAMSCGRAVLGTIVPGIGSLIQHEQNGLLCTPDSGAIRKGLERLMADKSLRIQLGQAARKYILETQTLDKLVAKELASYADLKRNKDDQERGSSEQHHRPQSAENR